MVAFGADGTPANSCDNPNSYDKLSVNNVQVVNTPKAVLLVINIDSILRIS